MTVWRPLAAAAFAALALTACAPGGDVSDDPVIWYDWNPNGPAMLALLQGTLVIEDGCLHADDTLIALPRDLGSWDPSAQTLTYGDSTFGVGDAIVAGGGGAAITPDMTLPVGCIAEVGDPVFLVQDQSLG